MASGEIQTSAIPIVSEGRGGVVVAVASRIVVAAFVAVVDC